MSFTPKTGAIPSPYGVEYADGSPVLEGDFAGSRLLAGMGTKLDRRTISLFDGHEERVQLFNDCVSHSRAALVQNLIFRRTGVRIKLAVAYTYAGAQHLRTPGQFQDVGSSELLTLKWIRDHGYVLDTTYPETLENITQLPPDDLWSKGEGATVWGCHKISGGSSAPDQSIAALALAEQGIATSHNVVIQADEAFGDLKRDEVLDEPGGAIYGGHSLAVLEYNELLDAFGLADTWGRYRVYISRNYLAKYCREMYVTEAAPAGVIQ